VNKNKLYQETAVVGILVFKPGDTISIEPYYMMLVIG
jgi:hypothetical protein